MLIITFPSLIKSQTGPAGVGQTNGSSELVLWLNTDDVSQGNGTNMSTWTDLSGYGNTANTVAGNEPTFQTNVLNGQSVVRFTEANTDYFEITDAASLKPNTISIFIVALFTDNSSQWSPFLIKTSTFSWTDGYGITRESNGNAHRTFVSHWSTNAVQTGQSANTFEIIGSVYDKVNIELFDNEVSQGADNYTSNIVHSTNPLYLGIAPNSAGTGTHAPLDGDIAEVIIIDQAVNAAERIIIHNYLSAKFDISLGNNDLYDEDNAGNGDYDYEVAGIGRVDASNIQDDAQGTGVVRILNPSGLGNDEFLMWGHDNGNLQATETTDVPAPVQARFDRVWRASEVNTSSSAVDVGSIDVRFDLADLNSITASDLRLLIDTDNDGVFSDETPIAGATSVGGTIYQFAGVTGIANNLRFTLGTINTAQTPLPVEFISFSAKSLSNNLVKLEWKTASEINNDYFSIERSKDSKYWIGVGEVAGAGNSSATLNYTFIDKNPYAGTSYYRLKQIDFNGKPTYSKIRSITMENAGNSLIKIFPNPITNQLTIIGDASELEEVKIYDSYGKDVTNRMKILNRSGNQMSVDLSRLSNGLYFVKTKKVVKKVYKQ